MRENKKLISIIIILVIFAGVITYSVMENETKKKNEAENSKKIEESINYLSYQQYEDILNGDTPTLVVLTQTGCSHCERAKEVFKKINDKYSYVINVLNITDLDKEERNSLIESLSYLKEEQWGTPLSLVLKNGKIVEKLNGYREFDDYVEFLKNNGMIGD